MRKVCSETGACPALLYLAEAHAAETWPLSTNAPKVHGSIEERLAAAQNLLAEYPGFAQLVQGRIYVDDLDNKTTLANGLWPERYLLLEGNHICWASSLSYEERFADVPKQLSNAARELWA